jgi:hypothetical protein
MGTPGTDVNELPTINQLQTVVNNLTDQDFIDVAKMIPEKFIEDFIEENNGNQSIRVFYDLNSQLMTYYPVVVPAHSKTRHLEITQVKNKKSSPINIVIIIGVD